MTNPLSGNLIVSQVYLRPVEHVMGKMFPPVRHSSPGPATVCPANTKVGGKSKCKKTHGKLFIVQALENR